MEIIIGSLLLVLVIIPVAVYVMQPLNRKRQTQLDGNPILSALMAERDHILTAIRDLDFDNTLGKIPAEEYPTQRDNLVRHGAQVLKNIDKLTPPQAGRTGPSVQKDEVESYLASRRNQTRINPLPPAERNAEQFIGQRRKNKKSQGNQHCPHCGKPVVDSDRFCPSCGKSLRKESIS
jgi:hypothetical protein